MLLGAGMAGNLSSDTHRAALAIEHGATLAAFDRDFDRLPACASSGCRPERARAGA